MQMFQELQPSDHKKKMTYCLWFNRTMDQNLLGLSFFNDEAWFQLSEYVNGENMCRQSSFCLKIAITPSKDGMFFYFEITDLDINI
jgi:hypothetical protein